jgi:hypothetical protein
VVWRTSDRPPLLAQSGSRETGYGKATMRMRFFLSFPRNRLHVRPVLCSTVGVRRRCARAERGDRGLQPSVISLRFRLIEVRLSILARRLRGEYDGHEVDLRSTGP